MKNEKVIKVELSEVVAHARADTGMTIVQMIRANIGRVMMKMTNGNPGDTTILTEEVRDFMVMMEKEIFMELERQAMEVMAETDDDIPNFSMEGLTIDIPEYAVLSEDDEEMEFEAELKRFVEDLLGDM